MDRKEAKELLPIILGCKVYRSEACEIENADLDTGICELWRAYKSYPGELKSQLFGARMVLLDESVELKAEIDLLRAIVQGWNRDEC